MFMMMIQGVLGRFQVLIIPQGLACVPFSVVFVKINLDTAILLFG
jgi:hypothetical protein